ncbi:MAG: DUF4294 domain-containing protein [Bacteroidaceae bacterium]|nr:DUF4294 domain-containing protein [Bacteroidaceae bacterium]
MLRLRQFIGILLFLSPLFGGAGGASFAQIVEQPGMAEHYTGPPVFAHAQGFAGMVEDTDGEMIPLIVLADVYVFPPLVFKNERQMKKYYKIANNIKKVYPIAVEIQHEIEAQIAHMDSLPTKQEKDAFLKQMEREMKKKWTPRLKKLTFSQGKLLIKLIDRQTNRTSYELIKTYMGGFKAGFYNAFASLFGASLKKEYDAEVDDRLTERCILLIESGQM